MADLEPVKGLIELTDNFTSEIGLAEAALQNFSHTNQESLKAVAEAAGIVGAAIIAIGVATVELGKRGSEVNDVNETLEHFAGSAQAADDAMKALRDGTKGTVDNFALASDAAHLLSAGVKLTTDDFSTLGQAAFVLQNRGLGPAKEQLDLVSDALVTGRTRALAMKLGVIDNGNAQEDYAKKLGVTVDKLSDAGKAEANRLGVMRILQAAVKDAGEQERNFGEEFEMAGAKVQNMIDDLASAVASSKVFKAGFEAVEKALGAAFGGDNQEMIQKIVKFLEDGAITVVNFGQIAITAARVFEGAWEGIRTVVLAVETAVVSLADTVIHALSEAAEGASKLKLVPDSAVQSLKDTDTTLQAMSNSLREQTVEAAKAVVGHTEFDKTLDGLSVTLTSVETAMGAAQKATAADAKSLGDASKASKDHAGATDTLSKSMIDREKVQKELEKSITELQALDSQYFAEVAKNSGTSFDAAKADVIAWEDAQKKSLDQLDPLYAKKFADIEAIANEKLKAIDSDWNSVRDNSIEGLQKQADVALQTYEDMVTSGLHFSREVLDAQIQKYRDLQERVRDYGHEVVDTTKSSAESVKILDSAWDAVGVAVDDNNVKVRTLHGEIISVKEALDRLNSGNTITYDLSTKEGVEQYRRLNTGAVITLSDDDIIAKIKAGWTLAQLIQAGFINPYGKYTTSGGSTPHFAEGGVVAVGENGPETVRLPFGSTVYPTGTPIDMMGGQSNQTLNFYVNGTAVQAAQQIKDIILRELQLRRQF